jgi:putative redox protein
MISAVARRRSGLRHEIDVNGHKIVVDEPEDAGGEDVGPSPSALLASALAGCTAITVEMYADRKGWDLEGLEVKADYGGTPPPGERAKFDVTVSVPEGLDDDQVDRIEKIANKCPIHRTLAGNADITVRTEVAGA